MVAQIDGEDFAVTSDDWLPNEMLDLTSLRMSSRRPCRLDSDPMRTSHGSLVNLERTIGSC